MEYDIKIVWSDEDNGFICTMPQFQGLSAYGENLIIAVRELLLALEAYLETLNGTE